MVRPARTWAARLLLLLVVLTLTVAPAGPVRAAGGTISRYALVVGNDVGLAPGLSLPALRHAEQDARDLAELLATYGKFDPERIVVVTGADRLTILAAAARLAALRESDRAQAGEVSTLFAFFYSGHGLRGQLLTPGDPLEGADLGAIFRGMDAAFSLGFFDTCYAGSLEAKGAAYVGPVNPLSGLPEDVLRAEGAIWLVSSKPDQVSYEDPEMGGVFTHYFKEAFVAAEADRVGVSLDRMWEYASEATQAHAERHGHEQTPQKKVERLRVEGPVYFSFPTTRSARLLLGEETQGTFVLRYPGSALVERVVKAKGAPLSVAVPSGPLHIAYPRTGDEPKTIWRVTVRDGETLRVRPGEPPPGGREPGFARTRLVGKGEEGPLVLETDAPRGELAIATEYSFRPTTTGVLGAPHSFGLGVDGAVGRWSFGGRARFGFGSADFGNWGLDQLAWGLDLEAGYALLTVAHFRLDALLGVSGDRVTVDYRGDAADRTVYGGAIRPALRAWLTFDTITDVFVRAGAQVRNAPGVAADDDGRYWSTHVEVGVGVLWRLF